LPNGLSPDQLKALARHGAANRIAELEAEIAAIRRTFPDTAGVRNGARREVRQRPAQADDDRMPKRRRRAMSAAARKAVGERMRTYWADRRKADGKK
jgi:hypothetical protein